MQPLVISFLIGYFAIHLVEIFTDLVCFFESDMTDKESKARLNYAARSVIFGMFCMFVYLLVTYLKG